MTTRMKIALSMVVILVALVAAVGGTMAWFTDSAEIDPNVFTAGTLLIDATDSWADNTHTPVTKWNPGDCDDKVVELEVVGTKRAFVRMKVTETWTLKYKVENGYVVKEDGVPVELEEQSIVPYYNLNPQAPYVTWQGFDPDEWQLIGDWLYFKGMLDPDRSTADGRVPDGPKKISVVTKVCFYEYDEDEEKLIPGNEYQGATYTLAAEFQAIQVTNEAVDDEWEVSWNGTNWE